MTSNAITPPNTCNICKPVITNRKDPAELLLGPVKRNIACFQDQENPAIASP
jgi:hypothetical protein